MMADRTILVTGGAGFVGAHVVSSLLSDDAENEIRIVVVDDLSGGFEDNISSDARVVFRRLDITDEAAVTALFDEFTFETVYHLAAYAAEGLSHFIRGFNYRNNLLGSVNLINNAVKQSCSCFVFASSIAVYGAAKPPMTEETVPLPEDPYGIAKYAVELDLKAAHEMFGLNYVIFRPHNVYGEYQNIGDRYRNVVGIFMNQILQGKPMCIFGDGEQQRAFSYVKDVAPLIAQAPSIKAARNKIFNVGADKPYTVNQLAAQVAIAMGKPDHPIEHIDARNEVHVAFSDHSHCRNVFGVTEETSLEQGLSVTAAWVQSVGARKSSIFSNIEVEKNMPPSWRV